MFEDFGVCQLLTIFTIFDIVEIYVYQAKDEFIAQQFTLYYFMDLKRSLLEWSIFVSC